ncbi:hypothetical protein FPSM_01831 [Flavobacterium psychrophilum]|nr:hypothetical protein FPSM_01831 [Flavobacterium psychrophilum]
MLFNHKVHEDIHQVHQVLFLFRPNRFLKPVRFL